MTYDEQRNLAIRLKRAGYVKKMPVGDIYRVKSFTYHENIVGVIIAKAPYLFHIGEVEVPTEKEILMHQLK